MHDQHIELPSFKIDSSNQRPSTRILSKHLSRPSLEIVVAHVAVAATLNTLPGGAHAVHVGYPRLRKHEYLSLFQIYLSRVPEVIYDVWKEEF